MYRYEDPHSPLLVISFGSHVLGVERRTGRIVWQQTFEAGWYARLLFPTGRVLLAYPQELVCLAYATGQMLWRTKVPVSPNAAVVDGNEVFFGDLGEVCCVDLNSGAVLWHHPFKGMGQGGVALGVPGNVAQVDLRR